LAETISRTTDGIGEEVARHLGHADILRERIDESTDQLPDD
jgi:hypothetical protein